MTREETKELLLHILMTYEPKDQYGDYDDPEPYEQALTMAIEALQDRPKGDWIPCSERFPSESGDYLCTIPLDADETYTEVLTFHKGRFYEDDAEWGATFHDDVLAWMPLPTPYKGGDDE